MKSIRKVVIFIEAAVPGPADAGHSPMKSWKNMGQAALLFFVKTFSHQDRADKKHASRGGQRGADAARPRWQRGSGPCSLPARLPPTACSAARLPSPTSRLSPLASRLSPGRLVACLPPPGGPDQAAPAQNGRQRSMAAAARAQPGLRRWPPFMVIFH